LAFDFQKAFEALPGAFMVLDRELRYVAASDGYCATVMRSRADLLGRNIFDLFPNEGESGVRLHNSFRQVLDSGDPDTLAYIPYDIPRPPEEGGGLEQRFWSATHTPIFDDDGICRYVMQHTTDVTELVRLRRVSTLPFNITDAERDVVERAQQAEQAHREALENSEQFRALFQQAPGFFAVMSGPSHIFTYTNDAYQRLVGNRSVIGRPVAEALPEVVEQGFVALLDEVYRTGERHAAQGAPVMLAEAQGDLRQFYLDFTYEPIRNSSGEVTGVFVQGTDATEATQSRRQQAMLIDELNHRVKNTLTSVRSIASQTFRPGREPAEARTAFDERLRSLSQTHDILSRADWGHASLEALVRAEFDAFGPDRVAIAGPDVRVTPKAAIALTLVVHELATNAVKYGALSIDRGNAVLEWQVEVREDGRWLLIRWEEGGGPPVVAPKRIGFGSRLMQTIVKGELGGRFDMDFDPSGVSARFSIPEDAYLEKGHAYG